MKEKISSKQLFTEIAGWYGMLAILTGYILVSFNVIAGNGLVFQLLNLSGAIGIIIISIYKHVIQSIALNAIWVVIAIVTILIILVNS